MVSVIVAAQEAAGQRWTWRPATTSHNVKAGGERNEAIGPLATPEYGGETTIPAKGPVDDLQTRLDE